MHLRDSRAKGTLVVPEWPAQLFMALLRPKGVWAHFVKNVISFPSGTLMFNTAAQRCSVFNDCFSRSPMLFLLLDFSPAGL
jgi:hypothetical protein